MHETAEEAVAREIKEETGLSVNSTKYLFSIPNIYLYSGFEVHTVDIFFRCTVNDFNHLIAQDDVSELQFIAFDKLNVDEFGLVSIRKGVEKILKLVLENK
jgi:8-oxo-dGTP pyrophosphatase MutT (NUDIX family)